MNILPGSKVMVFDCQLYIDDVKTPLSVTLKEAIVVRRYGYKHIYNGDMSYDDLGNRYGEPKTWLYPDCVDVIFDHDNRLSKGHFTNGVTLCLI